MEPPSLHSRSASQRSLPDVVDLDGGPSACSPLAASLLRCPASSSRPPPVLCVLAELLESLCCAPPDAHPEPPAFGTAASCDRARQMDVFTGARAPAISLSDYLQRVFRYAACSPSCFVLALVYVERLGFHCVSPKSVHRVVLAACLVATKWLDDSVHANSYWAKVGGVALAELNALEVAFLSLLDWRLLVSSDEFEAACERLAGLLGPGWYPGDDGGDGGGEGAQGGGDGVDAASAASAAAAASAGAAAGGAARAAAAAAF